MGFFDSVKAKYDALAADAGKAGKVTAAQARVVVLQNDVRRAERDLGKAAFALIESGELSHARLATVTGRVREAQEALREKEAEIAALRGGVPDGAPQAPEDTAVAAGDAVITEAVDEETGIVSEAEVVEEPVTDAAPPLGEAPAKKPAAPKPQAKKAPAKKTPAKPAATKKAPAKKKPASRKQPPPVDDAGA